ncbi:hypothetical protein C8R48DRAFT_678020 [Suillus tomentosus]|nr:hypothetical protein C8R48DRAFT_678020 [Suillus tomentosus]
MDGSEIEQFSILWLMKREGKHTSPSTAAEGVREENVDARFWRKRVGDKEKFGEYMFCTVHFRRLSVAPSTPSAPLGASDGTTHRKALSLLNSVVHIVSGQCFTKKFFSAKPFESPLKVPLTLLREDKEEHREFVDPDEVV